MLRFNIKIALRNIWKNKVFSAVNIIGLSISMASCILITSFIWTEYRHDTFHKSYKNIYRLTAIQNQAGSLYNVAVTPGPLAPALKADFPEIENTVRFGNWSGVLKTAGHVYEEKNIQLTENSFFNIFSFPLLKGNPNTALHAPDEIVITEKTAEKYFGKNWKNDNSVLGQTFLFNNETAFKLVGIVKNPPENSSIRFDVLLPLSYLFKTDDFSNRWNSNNFHTYVLLKTGTDPVAFENKIKSQLLAYNPQTADILKLQPLKQQYLYSAFDFKTDWGKRGNIKYVRIFAGAGLLLLLIACVNFINLSTARSLKRAKEVGVRKITGASRKELVYQFIMESLLVAGIAGLLSLVVISIAEPFLSGITGNILLTSTAHSMIIPFFLLLVLIIGLFAGLYPAFILSAFSPLNSIKKNTHAGAGKLFRRVLITGQFSISVVLITCTFFMYRQLRFMHQKDLGFDKGQLISFRLGRTLSANSSIFRQELDKLAGVEATAPSTMSMVDVENSSSMEWDGMTKDNKFLVTQANIDPGFIPALNIQMVAGNNFSRQITNDTANYILNETAAKRMGYTASGVIGLRVNFWGAKGKVIGVVKDFHFKPLRTGIEPFIFRYQPQDRYFSMFVKINAGRTTEIIKRIAKIYRKYETDSSFEFTFLDDTLNQTYRDDNRTAGITLIFASLTIFVGCLGLYGLSVFAAEQRTREIGIRKVLGAGVSSVARLLTVDFISVVISAVVIATPIAFYCTSHWLQQYAYRINIDWLVFVLVAALVIAISLITVGFQAIRVAVANPVTSLRTE